MSTQRVLISGSIAFDNIMVFEGYFKDHILPDKVHMLNVAFLTPGLTREHGGTAANIAYNLKLLGGDPYVLASVGANDGASYLERLRSWGVNQSGIVTVPNAFTAQAFITTDLAANQITAFHPGAMSNAHEAKVVSAALGLVSPNGKQAMHDHAQAMFDSKIPFIFDPGQGLPMFNGDELKVFLKQAQAVTVNDYEAQMLVEKTGLSLNDIASQVTALIVTLGAEGSDIYVEGKKERVLAATISKPVDPTGCGDSFRAGLVHARVNGWSWKNAACLGSVMGAVKIESAGAQNHKPTLNEIASRLKEAYGLVLPNA
jgi:adenosine kinase